MVRFARPRPISEADDFSSFDSGEPTLAAWIRTRVVRNERGGGSRTFVSVDLDEGRVAGYFCLSASSLRSEDSSAALRRNMPDPIPVILIGRAGRYQGAAVGRSLLMDAALRSLEASRPVGARAILVYALSDHAQGFYKHFGFTRVPESDRTLHLLVCDAERTLGEVAHRA